MHVLRTVRVEKEPRDVRGARLLRPVLEIHHPLLALPGRHHKRTRKTDIGSLAVRPRDAYGERVAARGGSWFDGPFGGIWELYLRETRAFIYPDIGFRAAYVEA